MAKIGKEDNFFKKFKKKSLFWDHRKGFDVGPFEIVEFVHLEEEGYYIPKSLVILKNLKSKMEHVFIDTEMRDLTKLTKEETKLIKILYK